jgi:carbon-monoxide dehydrogenase small subunit
MRIDFVVNGRSVTVEAPCDRRLIDILREDIGLIGPKNACGIGRCGACLVIVNDRPVNSCLVLAGQLAHRSVVTIEGLGPDGDLVVKTLARANVLQCGYCRSGLATALTWLKTHGPTLTPDEVEILLNGQICRCTGYGSLRRALKTLFQMKFGSEREPP